MSIYKHESTGGRNNEKKKDTDSPEKRYLKIFVSLYFKVVFGFVRHVDKINFGSGNTLTMKRAYSGNSFFAL